MEGTEGIDSIINDLFVVFGELSKSVGCQKGITDIELLEEKRDLHFFSGFFQRDAASSFRNFSSLLDSAAIYRPFSPSRFQELRKRNAEMEEKVYGKKEHMRNHTDDEPFQGAHNGLICRKRSFK